MITIRTGSKKIVDLQFRSMSGRDLWHLKLDKAKSVLLTFKDLLTDNNRVRLMFPAAIFPNKTPQDDLQDLYLLLLILFLEGSTIRLYLVLRRRKEINPWTECKSLVLQSQPLLHPCPHRQVQPIIILTMVRQLQRTSFWSTSCNYGSGSPAPC